MRDVKFDLHPWELKWNQVECEGESDFEMEVGGEVCQFRRVQSQLSSCPYFRFLSAPEEHFMLANFKVTDPRLRWEPLSYVNDNFSQVIRQDFQQAIEMHTWGRYFWLRPDLGCIQNVSEYVESVWNIFLLANGEGTMVGFRDSIGGSKSMSWNSVVPFQWHQGAAPEILRTRTSSQWVEWLQGEADKPESSIRFARDLAGLSGDEAKLRFTVWQHGNIEEWEVVVRWILQSESLLEKDDSNSRTLRWVWTLVGLKGNIQGQRGSFSRFGEDGYKSAPDVRDILTLQRLQIASYYFSPSLDTELIERCLSKEYHPRPLFLSVSTSVPSTHEKLEAALNLKAWSRGKFSAEEIEILCAL